MIKAVFRALKPTPLGVIMMLLVLLLQAIFWTSFCMTFTPGVDSPTRWQAAIGIGVPFSIILEENEVRGVTRGFRIRWAMLALNLVFAYLIAGLVAAVIVRVTHLRRPATTYATVAGIMIVVAFLVSIGISKFYWGYFFVRPTLLPEAGQLAEVKTVVAVKTVSDSSGQRALVAEPDYSFSESIAYGKKDSYYCLSERILIELERKSLLPVAHATTLSGLPELYPLINGSGMLAHSDEGYHSSDELRGVVVDSLDRSGSRLVFLGLRGGQVSNDHYPYYEMIFSGEKGASELSFVRGQRFFFDVAGVEGFEWPVIWILLSIPVIVAGFLLFTLGRGIWIATTKKRHAEPAGL